MNEQEIQPTMDDLVSLAKRRGFIFQGSEIYGGLAGTYDYGPLGTLLKENIKKSWMQKFVHQRTDMYALDAAILMNPKTWEATGHVDEFNDPLVEDLKTHKRYRADHILEDAGLDSVGDFSLAQMSEKIKELNLKSPDGNPLGEVRQFNMMLSTRVGASEDTASISYLRPETAQGIFVNYKNVLDSMNPKIPFGIAQIGKAFRNEITPRDFIFRLRELEQMEIEYFIHPSDWEKYFEYWKDEMVEWMTSLGLDLEKVHEKEISADERAHYSQRTIDFEFDFPFGKKELFGLAYRGDYDLDKHASYSKQKLQYTDQSTNETFVPHVIEPSMGLDRAILALLVSAYRQDEMNGEERIYLQLPFHIAPYKICVSPLLRNKPELVAKAEQVFGFLKSQFGNIVYDDNGNIGKRYRRQDEIGTPFCVVVDFETLQDDTLDTVTVRFRDSGEQKRIHYQKFSEFLAEQ